MALWQDMAVFWQDLLIQFGITFVAAGLAFLVFFYGLVRPWLNRKVNALEREGRQMEQRVAEGVRSGIEQSLQELPENTVKESTRSFRRMGTGLMENGLSTFLGNGGNHSRGGDSPSDRR